MSILDVFRKRDLPVTAEEATRQLEEDGGRKIKVPWAALTSAAGIGAEMIPALRTVKYGMDAYVPVNLDPGAVLKDAGNREFWPAFIDGDGKSKLLKLKKASSGKVTMPIDPMLLTVTVMIAGIEKKLEKIEEVQQSILSYLEESTRAEQEGDLAVLCDIYSSYKFNWHIEQYLANNHMKAMDIKQASEKNIRLYQMRIRDTIGKLHGFMMNRNIAESVAELEKLFREYAMALYLFGFSSFLEAMLLGNFAEEYLSVVSGRIEEYHTCFATQLDDARETLKKYSLGTVESIISSGLGSTGKKVGSLMDKVPLIKDTAAGKWLGETGEQLIDYKHTSTGRLMDGSFEGLDTGCECFTGAIGSVSLIANHTKGLRFEEDALVAVMD